LSGDPPQTTAMLAPKAFLASVYLSGDQRKKTVTSLFQPTSLVYPKFSACKVSTAKFSLLAVVAIISFIKNPHPCGAGVLYLVDISPTGFSIN
ncbi:MAG: hypothetical protein WD768_17915, partial [Phycisphaeraceae bacterium]